MSKRARYSIIIPVDMRRRPKAHEESAAIILSKHFCNDATFIMESGYGSPDIKIGSIEWELKSPEGTSRYTIQNNMRKAGHQSKNIVIDLRRVKMHQKRAIGYVNIFLSEASSKCKRVIVITKSGKVLVLR